MKAALHFKLEITSSRLILLSAVFFMTFTNATFFSNVLDVYPLSFHNIGFLASLALLFGGVIVLLLSLVCHKYTIKLVIIALLLVTSITSYFMDSYNAIIDDSMIQNVVQTDITEVVDLFSIKLLVYFVFLGALPSLLLYKTKIMYGSRWKDIFTRLRLVFLTLGSIVVVLFIFSDYYTSFFRVHKSLRLYANPTFFVYSTGMFIADVIDSTSVELKPIGLDARIKSSESHKLVIFVIGEAARYDRFSLNGYDRETSPRLQQERVISFTNFWSCGTTTTISVPCMFSIYDSCKFSVNKGNSTENVLDVLKHAGVNLLWLDNNSSSKGVANRITYFNYRRPENNPVCDIECRDEGMLLNLQDYIDEHRDGDMFIVLHQMGNHGPAYYKRYPPDFERFTPVCKTNQLEDCSLEELNNAYDNAILYTDYFLSKVIAILKDNQDNFDTAMIYTSDHGESLGENGLYLHGLPNFIAPETQRHIPVLLWIGDDHDEKDFNDLELNKNQEYSHDNIFHTILGLMNIETSVYDNQLDILHAQSGM